MANLKITLDAEELEIGEEKYYEVDVDVKPWDSRKKAVHRFEYSDVS